MEDQFWNKERHELRTRADQRFKARHPERNVSPVKKRDNVSIWKRRAHMKRHETVSGVAARDQLGISEDDGNVEELQDRSQAMNAMRSWADNKVNWQEREAGSHLSPLASPHTQHSSATRERLAREGKPRANSVVSRIALSTSPANRFRTDRSSFSKVKDGPDLVSEYQPSESEHFESSHDEGFQDPSLPGDGDNHQGLYEQTKRHAKEHYSQPQHTGMGNNHDPQFQTSNSGYALSDDDQVIRRDFGVWNPPDEQRRDHAPLPKTPIIDQSIDETDNGEKEVVSDKGKKPDDQERSSETSPDPNKYEYHSADVQLLPSEPKAPLIDASHGHITDGEHSDLEVCESEEGPESPPTPVTIEKINRDSQPMSPRSDHREHLDPQRSLFRSGQNKSPYTIQNPDTTRLAGDESPDAQQTSPGLDHMKSLNQQYKSERNDHLKSPVSKSTSPEPRGVIVKAVSIQDQVKEDDDAKAQLSSDAPLRENNRAPSHDSQRPRSSRPDHLYDAGSDKDSLIVSPVRSVRYPCSY